jgi:hypothetical protein
MMRKYYISPLALSVSLMIVNPLSAFSLGPVNTTQDGRIVKEGIYYNTPDNKTTFINSGAGGLWLQRGTTVRGLQVNSKGNLTNNGGTLHLYAPGNVVRVDGNINVNGIINNKGISLGNGGRVFIDSAYLYQNGHILANGKNGGLIQVNAGAVTLNPKSRLEARGLNGAGGVIAINTQGPVDMRLGSIIDTSGRVVGSFDTNLINIEGGVINIEGVLKADGIAAAAKGSRGGTIRLVASTDHKDIQNTADALQAASFISPGDPITVATISASERSALLSRLTHYARDLDGALIIGPLVNKACQVLGGKVSANGARGPIALENDTQGGMPRAGDGGTILLSAFEKGVINSGLIQANGGIGNHRLHPIQGGNGGTIVVLSQQTIHDGATSRIEANGGRGGSTTDAISGHGARGGLGGLIVFDYQSDMTHRGIVTANGAQGGDGPIPGSGGQGGLIMLGGNNNPAGMGQMTSNGGLGGNGSLAQGGAAGTIVSPNPGTLLTTLNATQQGYSGGLVTFKPFTSQTQVNELLTHNENLVLLTQNGGSSVIPENIFDRLLDANIRSVTDPDGTLGLAKLEVIDKNTSSSAYVFRNLLVGSNRFGLTLDLTPQFVLKPGGPTDFFPSVDFLNPSALSRGKAFETLNSLTIVNDGNVLSRGFFIDPVSRSAYAVQTHDYWQIGAKHAIAGGGRISILANGDVMNDNALGTFGISSGGSVHIASGTALPSGGDGSFYNGLDEGGHLFTDSPFHGGSILIKAQGNIEQTYDTEFIIPFGRLPSTIQSNGRLMGGVQQYLATKKIENRFESVISSNAQAQGGILAFKAGEEINNGPFIDIDELTVLRSAIEANASSPRGRGGFIQFMANNLITNELGTIEANGGKYGGTVSLAAGDYHLGTPPGVPDPLHPFFVVDPLTPPKTKIQLDGLGPTVSIYNTGTINALGGPLGRDGNIYLGGNNGVLFASPSSLAITGDSKLNNVEIRPDLILSASSPNLALQSMVGQVKANGGHVFVVAGHTLTNKAGQTRTAVQIINSEAAPNHSEPNVNPVEDAQGSELPDDFEL